MIIKRAKGARSYVEHDLLVKELEFLNVDIFIFDGSGTLAEHISLFAKADIVIGPHGAGFANLIFCKPKTGIIEIGWDGTEVMEMDNMYYRLALSVGLRYRLILGHGQYGAPLSCPVEAVYTAYKELASGS